MSKETEEQNEKFQQTIYDIADWTNKNIDKAQLPDKIKESIKNFIESLT